MSGSSIPSIGRSIKAPPYKIKRGLRIMSVDRQGEITTVVNKANRDRCWHVRTSKGKTHTAHEGTILRYYRPIE